VIEQLKLPNLHIDHVVIRSELKYLIGATIVNLKCRVFGCKTGPFPTVRVFREVRTVATVRFRVEPDPELTRQFGPVANTSSPSITIIVISICGEFDTGNLVHAKSNCIARESVFGCSGAVQHQLVRYMESARVEE
jgi:hypothetical protein